MDLNEIVIFIKVAQLGSFSAAGKFLDIPKSTVSTKISNLEKRLAANLIHRTTRKINLTTIGQQFYERCVTEIENIKNAEEEIANSKKSPSGKLVISAPVFLGNSFLPQIICDYKKEYPDVNIELVLTDREVDLIGEGVDLAIRAGKLADSSFLTKKIGETYFGLFASKAYLKKFGTPTHPIELKNHNCLQFTPMGRDKWSLSNSVDKQSVSVPMKKSFIADDLHTIKNLTLKSEGISLLPMFLCHEDVKAKELVQVLPKWKTEVRPVSFLYPSGKFVPAKVKHFMEKAEKTLQYILKRD